MSRENHIRKNKGLKENAPRFFLLIAFIVITLVFQIMQPNFLNITNVMNLLAHSSIIGILACGNMILMAAGEMSFSVGAQCTVAGALFGWVLAKESSNSILLALVFAMVIAAMIGLVLAFFTVKLKVPTFVCTLAMGTVLDGFTQILTGGSTLHSSNWPPMLTIMQKKIGGVFPLPIIVFLIIAVITHIIYEKTKPGRHLYAVGSNPTAANNVGISVPKVKVWAFAISGTFCGIAGVTAVSYNNSVSLTLGGEYLMPAIAATMLSATFLKLGKYNVPGTVLAAVLMIVIQNGVVNAGYPIYVKDIVQGILLTVAVAIIVLIKEDGLPSVKLEN